MREGTPGGSPAPADAAADPAVPTPAPSSASTAGWIAGALLFFLALFTIPPLLFAGAMFGVGLMAGILPVLALLVGATVLLVRGTRDRTVAPSTPGLPAPFNGRLYGIPPRASLADRLRAMEPRLRRAHAAVLWTLAGLVAAAGLAILAAILAGPAGADAALAGLLLLVGWLLTLAAYFAAGYRALVPLAVALGLYGVLLHVQSVADAWGLATGWNPHALLGFAVLAPAQGFAAEAAFSRRPRPVWAGWLAVGLVLAAALPAWLLVQGDAHGADPDPWAGLAFASLAWGAGAAFAFPPLPAPLRWAGAGVFALWAAGIAFAMGSGSDLGGRLQAAGMVAAAVTAAVALTAYFVARPRAVRA